MKVSLRPTAAEKGRIVPAVCAEGLQFQKLDLSSPDVRLRAAQRSWHGTLILGAHTRNQQGWQQACGSVMRR